jgi:hypothetical protein
MAGFSVVNSTAGAGGSLALPGGGGASLNSSAGSFVNLTSAGGIEINTNLGAGNILLNPLATVTVGTVGANNSKLATDQILNNNGGTFGTAGQVLSSDGTRLQWTTPGGASTWSTFPATQTVNMAGQDLVNANASANTFLRLLNDGSVLLQDQYQNYLQFQNGGAVEISSLNGNNNIFLTPKNLVQIGDPPNGSPSVLIVNQIYNIDDPTTFGTAGQVLSSDGSKIQWINPGPAVNSSPIIVIGGSVATNYTLNASDVNKVFPIATSGPTGPWTLNFVPGGTFPDGGTFFIKNMGTTNPVLIQYNGTNAAGNDTLYPITLGTNNGFLCIGTLSAGVLAIY